MGNLQPIPLGQRARILQKLELTDLVELLELRLTDLRTNWNYTARTFCTYGDSLTSATAAPLTVFVTRGRS